jgi:hypothetical protein
MITKSLSTEQSTVQLRNKRRKFNFDRFEQTLVTSFDFSIKRKLYIPSPYSTAYPPSTAVQTAPASSDLLICPSTLSNTNIFLNKNKNTMSNPVQLPNLPSTPLNPRSASKPSRSLKSVLAVALSLWATPALLFLGFWIWTKVGGGGV